MKLWDRLAYPERRDFCAFAVELSGKKKDKTKQNKRQRQNKQTKKGKKGKEKRLWFNITTCLAFIKKVILPTDRVCDGTFTGLCPKTMD